MANIEKLPDIYSPRLISNQSIKARNEIIDEYIKSLDEKKEDSKQNENSFISDDEKDPFSSKNIKNLKHIKSNKNRLILPNFKKRESTKSHSFSKKENKELKKMKNYSENNIIQRNSNKGKLPSNFKALNNKINSKWITCNYINNFVNNCKTNPNDIFKFKGGIDNLHNQKYFRTNLGHKSPNKKNYTSRINSTLNTKRILENKRQIYEKLIREKDNPYGLNWLKKIFKKNNREKIELSKREFQNGVPVIKILGKKDINKKEIKKKLSEIQRKKKEKENEYNKIINAEARLDKGDLDEEYNLPKEILEQFNQNKKNFFKFRKEIIEEPDEEEQNCDK